MAKRIERLSAQRVSTVRKPGYYADGGGLYLQVSQSGSKSWIFRFTLNGRPREMGLGSRDTFDLAEARDRARECRQLLDAGIDPIAARDQRKAQERLDAAKTMTFTDCATRYIAANRAAWRNAKHAAQWGSTLETYAYPIFGGLPVQGIDVGLVMRVLEPIWQTKTETAVRLRGRIAAILDWATAHGLRSGDNPARWHGHLDKLLPKRSKVRAVEHHAALPYGDLPAFMAALHEQDGIAARALEFTILTAARTGEVADANHAEIDRDEKTWTVPAVRMKAKREHRVPLSPRALRVLESLPMLDDGKYLFPGARARKPLSNMAMRGVLRRMGRGDLTVHGFRSTFRDWAAECTNFRSDIAERALAHVVGDKTEQAYQRSDLFEKRRRLMNEWAHYCGGEKIVGRKVVPIGKRQAA